MKGKAMLLLAGMLMMLATLGAQHWPGFARWVGAERVPDLRSGLFPYGGRAALHPAL